MDLQLLELQLAVKERNEITIAALECTVFVLTRAHGLPPEQRQPMVDMVKNLISFDLSVMLDNADLN